MRIKNWGKLAFFALLVFIAGVATMFSLAGFVQVDPETGQPVPLTLSCGEGVGQPPPEVFEAAPDSSSDDRDKNPNPPPPPPPPRH